MAGIVRLAAAHRVPLVPRGAGTGLSGGAIAVAGGLTVSLVRMNRVLEIDEENRVVVVQPGVVNADLKMAVAAHGLLYAPDPASYETCTIGGNLATNSGGLCCVKYGVTRDAVLGLEVVLADGAVIRTGGRNVKDVAGYDLAGLFVGSMGTLGIVTEATLRLIATPAPKQTLLAFFPTIEASGAAVAGMVRDGVQPCTLELMDAFTHPGGERGLLAGPRRERGRDAPRRIGPARGRGGSRSWTAPNGPARRQGSASSSGRRTRRRPTCSARAAGWPTGRSRRWARAGWRTWWCRGAASRTCSARSTRSATGTAWRSGSSGTPATATSTPPSSSTGTTPPARRGCSSPRTTCTGPRWRLGGSVTGEHGIGVIKRSWLEATRGPDAVRVMRAIKAALDPLGILNPGKML